MTGLEPFILAAGAVASGISAFRQGQFQSKVAEQQADFARKQSAIDAEEFERNQRRVLGTARAARGSSGVLLSEGSPLLVDDETLEEILFQTERVRRGGAVQGARLDQQGQLDRAAGTSGLVSGISSAAGTILGSGLSFGGTPAPQTGGRVGATRPGRAGDGLRG
jgi:hypothetical protein